MQVRLQAHSGAARRIVFTAPHTASDNGVPHQLAVSSKFSSPLIIYTALCELWGMCLLGGCVTKSCNLN